MILIFTRGDLIEESRAKRLDDLTLMDVRDFPYMRFVAHKAYVIAFVEDDDIVIHKGMLQLNDIDDFNVRSLMENEAGIRSMIEILYGEEEPTWEQQAKT